MASDYSRMWPGVGIWEATASASTCRHACRTDSVAPDVTLIDIRANRGPATPSDAQRGSATSEAGTDRSVTLGAGLLVRLDHLFRDVLWHVVVVVEDGL